MSDTKFQASEPSSSEEENFEYFPCISIVQTQEPLGLGHSGPLGHYLNKLGKGLLPKLHTKFQVPELSSSGEDF